MNKPGWYQRRPTEVQAFLFLGETNTDARKVPVWFTEAVVDGSRVQTNPDHIELLTNSGWARVNIGDWIIRGATGELYPCKDGIFRSTYEVGE